MALTPRTRSIIAASLLLGVATFVLAFLDEMVLVRFSFEEQAAEEQVLSEPVIVVRVVDGDTFELENGEKVRLIGVDTPESVKSGTAIQCFGKEAASYLTELIGGKAVRLERDVSERDRYGRLLRYAYLGELFVNDFLVREGYAYAATFPPDVREQERFRDAQNEARAQGRGLWAAETCDGKR
jgi:micrococcal nuclease